MCAWTGYQMLSYHYQNHKIMLLASAIYRGARVTKCIARVSQNSAIMLQAKTLSTQIEFRKITTQHFWWDDLASQKTFSLSTCPTSRRPALGLLPMCIHQLRVRLFLFIPSFAHVLFGLSICHYVCSNSAEVYWVKTKNLASHLSQQLYSIAVCTVPLLV